MSCRTTLMRNERKGGQTACVPFGVVQCLSRLGVGRLNGKGLSDLLIDFCSRPAHPQPNRAVTCAELQRPPLRKLSKLWATGLAAFPAAQPSSEVVHTGSWRAGASEVW